MNYRIRVNGEEIRAQLSGAAPVADGWKRAELSFGEGLPEQVEARLDGDALVFTLGGRVYRAFTEPPRRGPTPSSTLEVITLEGETFEAEVIRDEGAIAAVRTVGANEAVRVTSPMPGRVVSVRVKVGDWVARGELLLTLEAMKMQNEFTAPSAGRVAEIRVQPGAVAAAGETLIVLKP